MARFCGWVFGVVITIGEGGYIRSDRGWGGLFRWLG